MALWTIVEQLTPTDLPDWYERSRARRFDATQPDPLDDFVADSWREREVYDDQSDDDGAPPKMPIDQYLAYLNATTGRVVKVVP